MSGVEKDFEQPVASSPASTRFTHNDFNKSNMSLENQIKRNMLKKPEKNTQTFDVGNRVKHNVFGEGTVLSAKSMANDTMLEIAFDTRGTKKVMANFAKITRI